MRFKVKTRVGDHVLNQHVTADEAVIEDGILKLVKYSPFPPVDPYTTKTITVAAYREWVSYEQDV